MRTFAEVLAHQLRSEPGRPLVTYYDESTGERVELSVTTYANWVAKAAGLLADEHGLERGQRLCVDLPAHWLGPVFLGAAWTVGLAVVGPDDSPDASPDAVVCGPGTLERWSAHAADLPVLACALLPLGVRFAEPVPPGVHDVGVEIWSQPDAFGAWDPPGPGDPATAGSFGDQTQGELWAAAAAGRVMPGGGRLLTTANPASPPALATATEPLVTGGSLVLVVGSGPERLQAIFTAERATVRFP